MRVRSNIASPFNSSKLSSSEQIAIYLRAILLLALTVYLRKEGGHNMTCRVARLSTDLLRVDVVFCCECGSADLEVCSTSKALGPHLCPTCAQSMVECGASKQTRVRLSVRGQPVA